MEVSLFIKEGDKYKQLSVPLYIVRDLLRDRLSKSEVNRINRLARSVSLPEKMNSGSVLVEFESKTANCFQAGIDIDDLEPSWKVNTRTLTLNDY